MAFGVMVYKRKMPQLQEAAALLLGAVGIGSSGLYQHLCALRGSNPRPTD